LADRRSGLSMRATLIFSATPVTHFLHKNSAIADRT
jgi:hypothetical protein